MKPGWEQVINPKGEKSSAVCWNTPYRNAFFELVRTVVSKYDVDGADFDSWLPFYSFNGQICYCEGCRKGFKKSEGKEIPYKEKGDKYTSDEIKTIDRYREWYVDQMYEAFRETSTLLNRIRIYLLSITLIILQGYWNSFIITCGSWKRVMHSYTRGGRA